jgi:hypothetical protein
MKYHLGWVLAFAASLGVLPACGAPETALPAAEASAAAPDQPALGPNLLFNPSFELWEGDALQGWAVAQGQGAAWTPVPVTKVKGIHRASYAVAVAQPPAEAYAILAQNIAKRWVETGKKLYFGAVIRALHPHQAQVVLTYRAGGQDHKVRAVHSGSGDWESVHGAVDIPADADPDSFRLELFRNPGLEGQVLFDDAGVAYAAESAAPATASDNTPKTE